VRSWLNEQQLARLRARYHSLLEPGPAEAQLTGQVDGDSDAAELRARLSKVFAEHPDADGIMLVTADGDEIGVAGRARVTVPPGHAGATDGPVDPGSSDGATLPGHPTGFRAVEFRCVDEGCTVSELRAFYDDRYLPECSDHGPMGLRR